MKPRPSESLLIRVTKAQRAALERRRRETDQSVTAQIRQAIDEYLERQEGTTPASIAAKLATIGYVRGLVDELRAELAGQEGGNHGAR